MCGARLALELPGTIHATFTGLHLTKHEGPRVCTVIVQGVTDMNLFMDETGVDMVVGMV